MKPIAAPIVGGMITSTVHVLMFGSDVLVMDVLVMKDDKIAALYAFINPPKK